MPESYEHEVRVAGGSGHGQNLVFLGFQGHNVDFLIFRAEAYTCWSARFARSRVGGVARLFKQIPVFFRILDFFFIFRVFFGHFSHFSQFFAFYHEKKTVFGHFIRFRYF